jgi:hypothetical protein
LPLPVCEKTSFFLQAGKNPVEGRNNSRAVPECAFFIMPFLELPQTNQ